jgi:Xaa-Pro aminopeptidase
MAGDDASTYGRRRARIRELLGPDAVLVLPAAPEVILGRDMELRYRADPDLYYLTGYTEPGAVMVLAPGHEEGEFTLFVRPRDPDQERWSGVRGGPEAALDAYGADQAYPLTELEERLPAILAHAESLYFPLGGGRGDVESLVYRTFTTARRRRQRHGRGPRALVDPGALLDELRLVKEPHELALLAEAARLSAEAFLEVAPLIRPGLGEWEIEAALEQAFRRRGADGVAFATIVGSGPNATVLHYLENNRVMRAGELLLIDAGASWQRYNGDISRTFPVSGSFTPLQREVYDAVIAAHTGALAAVRPGGDFAAVHEAAVRALTEALLELGVLDGDLDELVGNEAYKPYYPHQTSHWLGLDVHDVGDYAIRGGPRPLAPGMVLTIEPGLYFPPDDEKAPAELRGVGIRIEDDVVVTDSGHEVLTAALPRTAAEVEALLTGG